MATVVVDLNDVDGTQGQVVGGKGAALGELSRTGAVQVPEGFCVTTDAYRQLIRELPEIGALAARLSELDPGDGPAITETSAAIRQGIRHATLPATVQAAIVERLAQHGADATWAVRSSATAEDLPEASFAGQHDSHLNVVGPAVLDRVRECWASLYTERAVDYRLRHGIAGAPEMAVVVQRMVPARAAGVLFTADPLSGHRKVAVIEVVAGLGEQLVSGRVSADVVRVRDGAIVELRPAHERPVLDDSEVLRLVELGRTIEAHFGHPQDIEWCIDADGVWIVQSRPITTLFPVPDTPDADPHVYVSVGHQQMMTEAMKPLGISVWQLSAPRPMYAAGNRLFVDVAAELGAPETAAGLIGALGRSDPLIGGALQAIVDRGDVIPARTETPSGAAEARRPAWRPPGPDEPELATDGAIVTELIEQDEASLAELERELTARSGPELLAFILEDFSRLRQGLFDPRSLQVIMAGMQANFELAERLGEWLGDRGAVDTLSRSVPGNVTSEMGLALLDVADAVRPHREVIALLERADDESMLDRLAALPGGREAGEAITTFLDRYGVRCVGEIDITRPRWRERPALLVPMILANVRNFTAGEGQRRFDRGRQQAEAKEREVLSRLRALPDGEPKAEEAKRLIDRIRTFSGYREYPKFGKVRRYFAYKRAILREAEQLTRAGVLPAPGDAFYLTLQELHDVARTGHVDHGLIRARAQAFASAQTLVPPRVFTSDGEVVTAGYGRRALPAGALPGLPVSAGTVEGRARVVRDVAEADLEAGDILVTAYTDPSWTPHFVALGGLVTEVGGLMTHGAVIAREYGLPAVVGVERATELIEDGQQLRVHGTDGYVEILPRPADTSR